MCFFVCCVTVMFQNPADGFCADRALGSSGSAKRRRERRLRAVLRHERQTSQLLWRKLTTTLRQRWELCRTTLHGARRPPEQVGSTLAS